MSNRGWWSGWTAETWRVGRLKDLVEVTNGFPFDSTRFSDSRGTPLIRIRDLLRGYTETYFDGPTPDVAIVDDGDLLVGMDGDFNSGIWTGGRAVLNQRMCRLRARPGLDQRFLRYLIDLPLRYINDLTYSTTVKHLSSTDLINERIPLPPIEVQLAIADYLDTETARIDALIEKKQTMIALLANRHRQLVRDFTLTSGEERPLRRVVTTVKTGTTPNTESEFLEDGFEWATPGDFTDGLQLQLTARRVSKEAVEAGEIPVFPSGSILVVGIGATAGRVALADRSVSSNQQVTAISPGSDVDRKFLAWQLWSRTDELRELAPYTTLPILNNEFLRSFVVKVPSLDVQLGIAQTLDLHWAKTATLQLRLRRQVELLHKHRQALITAAVTGELEVPGVAA